MPPLITPALFPHHEAGFPGCAKLGEPEDRAKIERPKKKRRPNQFRFGGGPVAGVFRPNCKCSKCDKKNG